MGTCMSHLNSVVTLWIYTQISETHAGQRHTGNTWNYIRYKKRRT